MLAALGLSIAFGLMVGILAARNRRAETVIIPLLDVFQSIPILAFFPIVILGAIAVIPGALGVNLAVVLLIFTSMSWNLAFGVYEAVKSIPHEYVELARLTEMSGLQRVRSLYAPASMSRIASNAQTSWAVGLFYLVSSEIIIFGKSYSVPGIGTAIYHFIEVQDYAGYVYATAMLVFAVAVWQFLFLRELSLWSERYKFIEEPRGARRDPLMRFYSWVNQRSISKLFLLSQNRGVTRFTSALAKFRRGLKYAVLIAAATTFIFVAAASAPTASSELSSVPSLGQIAATEASILWDLAVSFARIWYVYVAAVAVGVPLAVALSLRSRVYQGLSPVIVVVASIPAPVLLPVIYVAAGGNGEGVAAAIIFLAMVWYIIFNVAGGIRSLPSEITELKKTFHLSTFQAWRSIYLPASVTALVTGSITAVGAAWNALIVAEYFSIGGAPSPVLQTEVGTGIGKAIVIATAGRDVLTLSLAVLSMTALIVVFNLTVWRRVYHYATKRYTYNR